MDKLWQLCFLFFICFTLVCSSPVDNEKLLHEKNCSCVTKEEVYDLWDRVAALENYMNETEEFAVNVTDSNSTSYDGELSEVLHNTNSTVSDNGTVDLSNGTGRLASSSAKQKDDNTSSEPNHLTKQDLNVTKNPSSFPNNNESISTGITWTTAEYPNAPEGEMDFSINSTSKPVKNVQDTTLKEVTRAPLYIPDSESDSLLAEALAGGSRQIKLNHSLLTATYSSILSIKDRINSLNSTVQNLQETIRRKNVGIKGNSDINSMAHFLQHDQITSPTKPTSETDVLSAERGSFVEMTKLVAAMEERLNLLESRLNSQVQKGGAESLTTEEVCEGARKHRVGTSCYSVPRLQQGTKLFSWWDARYWCKDSLGAHADLVTVDDEKEMQQLITLINNHFGDIEEFWLGGNDLNHEGDWRWISNDQQIAYSNWRDGPPPKDTYKNCMSMLAGHQWVPEPCYFDRYPLCELHLGSP